MSFAHPYQLLWLLAWFVFMAFLLYREGVKKALVRQFLESPMLARLGRGYRPRQAYLSLGLRLLGLAFMLLALAGPQWGSETVKLEREGLDVVFVVDCSRSMQAEDPPPTRMAVAQRELTELAHKLQGNRLGLVGFAGSAFIFCPLTLDVGATQLFLEQLNENAIPNQGTSLGEAMRVAMTTYPKDDKKKSRIMVLLTDGEDHHSQPLEVAKLAVKEGITIYTVGIGSAEGKPIPERDADGNVLGYLRDSQGQVVQSRLDEKTLKEIAKISGGQYLHVGSENDSLDPIVKSILSSERKKLEGQMLLKYQARFQIVLALGLFLLALGQSLAVRSKA